VFGCFGPQDNALFSPDGAKSTLSGVGGTGGESNSVGGTGSGPQAGADAYPSPSTGGSETSTAGGGGVGSVGGGSAAGMAGGGGVTTVGGAGEGGDADPTPTPARDKCETIEGAVFNETNGHCYRVNLDELDFAAAREACHAAGAHLVTVDSEIENGFLHDLLPPEHWLGASDGLADMMEGVGTYAWVNDEPWGYDAWHDGQPNAYGTNCPDPDHDSTCFEHCGFQTDQGDWYDRSCWHTIPSVCEWEPDAAARTRPSP
jgi:hypothetical protein